MLKKIIKYFASFFIIHKVTTKGIYLTFDDGPHPTNTLKVLKVLDKYNMKASFFMVGQEVEKFPNIALDVQSKGHTLGYHSYGHKNLKHISYSCFIDDLNKAKKLEKKYNLNFNKLYRPPYGGLSLLALIHLKLKSWKVILWSKDSMDSYSDTHDFCEVLQKNSLSDGEVILMHDDGQNTADNLDRLLKALLLSDYSFNKLNT